MKALVVGATGLVGRECLRLLLKERSYDEVVVIARRAPMPEGERPAHLRVVLTDFDRLGGAADAFRVDHVFCALGTTIRKAGTQAAFRHVDHDLPLQVATLALERGARHFVLVSAIGASARSAFFYNRVKGELEDALRTLGYRSLTILRPSLLLGDRGELRLAEKLGSILGMVTPARLRPVHARHVAAAMVGLAQRDEPGLRIVESREIRGAA